MHREQILSEKSLQDWINQEYRSKAKIHELNQKFKSNAPFPHLLLEHFFNEEKLAKVLKALEKEEFLEKESDLFKFMQTHDFATSSVQELKDLRTFLSSKEFLAY